MKLVYHVIARLNMAVKGVCLKHRILFFLF